MLYFDTSFLAPLILDEATSIEVERFMAGLPAEELAISHWTRVEFSSLLAREVRIGGLKIQARRRQGNGQDQENKSFHKRLCAGT